jgi:hypothetical protein
MADGAAAGDGANAAVAAAVAAGALPTDTAAIAVHVANALIMTLGLPRAGGSKPTGDATTTPSAAAAAPETPGSATADTPVSSSFSDVLSRRTFALTADAANATAATAKPEGAEPGAANSA